MCRLFKSIINFREIAINSINLCPRLMRPPYFWLSVDGLFYLLEIISSRSDHIRRTTHTAPLQTTARTPANTLLCSKNTKGNPALIYINVMYVVRPLPLKPAVAISLFTSLWHKTFRIRHTPMTGWYTSNRKQWWRWLLWI